MDGTRHDIVGLFGIILLIAYRLRIEAMRFSQELSMGWHYGGSSKGMRGGIHDDLKPDSFTYAPLYSSDSLSCSFP